MESGLYYCSSNSENQRILNALIWSPGPGVQHFIKFILCFVFVPEVEHNRYSLDVKEKVAVQGKVNEAE